MSKNALERYLCLHGNMSQGLDVPISDAREFTQTVDKLRPTNNKNHFRGLYTLPPGEMRPHVRPITTTDLAYLQCISDICEVCASMPEVLQVVNGRNTITAWHNHDTRPCPAEAIHQRLYRSFMSDMAYASTEGYRIFFVANINRLNSKDPLSESIIKRGFNRVEVPCEVCNGGDEHCWHCGGTGSDPVLNE